MSLVEVAGGAISELQERSRKKIYLTDPEAWLWDILGRRWWSRQAEIARAVVGDGNGQTFTLVKSANGTGKALSLDTPLPTPEGWTTMGDVREGDTLLDESGSPTRVTFKSETQYDETYRVVFSDGAEIIASGPHQWNTLTQNVRSHLHTDDWRNHWDSSGTLTTAEMAHTVKLSNARNHLIPINQGLDLPRRDLPIDPYVLGAWLGDGSSDSAYMTVGETSRFVIEEFKVRGYDLRHAPKLGVTGDLNYSFTRQGFVQAGRGLGIIGNKHIPDTYLRASLGQRWELLRGLMDTDGFVESGTSMCGIDLANERLARGVAELIRSLGIRVSLTKADSYLGAVKSGIRYRMVFNPLQSPFSKSCYKSEWFTRQRAQVSRRTARTVVSVQRVETVATACVQVDSPRSLYLASEWMIPTHNTQLGSDLMTWAVSVHDPLETTVLATANVFSQISDNAFKYITNNYSTVQNRIKDGLLPETARLPGRIISNPAVRYERGPGLMPKDIIIGRRPADSNLLSSFQGTHDGFVFVLLDEAGGLPEDLWIGANAVTTNEHTAIFAVGNPDQLNTGFHKRFEDPEKYSDWKRFTLSAYDTPNFTGEVVYPEDPEREKYMRSKMIQVLWARRMEKEAHPDVVKSKVLGEFPDSDDSSFFSPNTINAAYEADITPDASSLKTLGIDLAFSGSDKTAVYLNHGGKIRLVDEWIHEDDFMKVAGMIHKLALKHAADEVRVDAGGTGRGIYSLLETQFPDKTYLLVGLQGGHASPDNNQWAQARSWHYDSFRRAMAMGEVDLDPSDEELRTELVVQPYEVNRKGAIQLSTKSDMRKSGLHSPDHLDAVIYSFVDITPWTGNPYNQFKPGERVIMDPEEQLQHSGFDQFYDGAIEF